MELVTCVCGWPVLVDAQLRRVIYGSSDGRRPLIHRSTLVCDADRCVCPRCELELTVEPVFNGVGSGFHGLVVTEARETGVAVA